MLIFLFFDWLVSGLIASSNFGRIGHQGVFLPLVISAVFGIIGLTGALVIVWEGVSKFKTFRIFILGMFSLAGLIVSAGFLDSTSKMETEFNGNAALAAGVYFLTSGVIVIFSLAIFWLRKKVMDRQALEIAKEKERERLLFMPLNEFMKEVNVIEENNSSKKIKD